MQLLFATGNKSKLEAMQEPASRAGIRLIGLDGITTPLPEIDETGASPLDNARIKALAYYKALKIPLFSCDSGLYIDGLDDTRQPGVYVRRINGRRLNDDEMIAHYSAIAAEFGGSVTARYRNAICLVLGDGSIHEYAGDDIATDRFMIVAAPHPKRSEGFPIDSLSVHIPSGKYYYDIEGRLEEKLGFADGFAAFFRRALHDGAAAQSAAPQRSEEA